MVGHSLPILADRPEVDPCLRGVRHITWQGRSLRAVRCVGSAIESEWRSCLGRGGRDETSLLLIGAGAPMTVGDSLY
jgi:hypothetical protein